MTVNETVEAAATRLTQRVKDRTGTLSRSPIVDDVALILADHATQAARIAELEGEASSILAKVVRLVIAARKVAFDGAPPGLDADELAALDELDKASEAFADRVPWEDDLADRVAGEAEPKTIAGLCDCCSSWFGDLEQNTESEWLCGPCRVEEPAPPAAVAERTIPEPPWEATSLGGNNAKREGWKAYHTKGRTREACPFPANRHDLLAAYCIGWDAAAEQTDGEA